ncbi:universal stress protein [Bacillus sp. T33-2]|uniref:universal stress protein n=1 Tax=Bacillus sp. T33-2 TaxID=2054168 RepID=UPI000C78BBE9|nr:universal stress protein [Bacillus sp. T33-2]PLR90084.1 universal stress protein [Bacillus sp. T33-2]
MIGEFSKVIVAFDNTDGSRKALELAKNFKRNHPGLTLVVVHVVQETIKNTAVQTDDRPLEPVGVTGFVGDGIQIPPMTIDQEVGGHSTHAKLTNSSDQAFYNAKEELRVHNINAEFQLLEGDPSESLCDFANEAGADLIIIGRTGKTGLRQMILGGVSERVAKNAPCHVLIAK